MLALTRGVLAVQRVGDEAEAVARLVHTARTLERIDDPSVERLVGLERDSGGVRLTTAFAGGRSFATCPPADVGSTVAEVCGALARLHALGIAHGPVTPTQVVLAADGHAVLCDFDGARLRSDEDDSSWHRCCAIDVRSVGTLLEVGTHPVTSKRSSLTGGPWRHRRLRRVARRLTDGRIADALTAETELRRALGDGGAGRRSAGCRHRHRVGSTRRAVAPVTVLILGLLVGGHLTTYRFTHRIPPPAAATAPGR